MDDLLIVRLSDRSKSRYVRRREPVPLGAAFGLICGVALGIRFSAYTPSSPAIGATLGIAFGLALGGLFGRFLKPSARRQNRAKRFRHYQGMPFTLEETPEDSDEHGQAER